MVNPYYIYIVTFSLSLIVYQFGWSTLFPELKLSVILFLLLTIGISFVLGFFFHAKKYISFKEIKWNNRTPIVVIAISLLWVIEFIYNGGIPLFLILRGVPYNYVAFGIPTLHVFVVTFTSFFSVYLFHVYISTRRKNVLAFYLLTMSFAILLFNRGMLMINITSSVFVYLQYVRVISFRKLFLLSIFFTIILYAFGVLGNLRSSHDNGTKYSSTHILSAVKANEKFVNSRIPSEFIWSYLYISSPLANFQHNVDKNYGLEQTPYNLILFVNNEFIFDFISKRINKLINAERVNCLRFVDSMTVASVYTNSFIYFQWTGLALMAIFILCVPILYLGLIRRRNEFYVTGTAILGSLYFFLIFDNMFTFTGLSFQLVYPLIFDSIFTKKKKFDNNSSES